MLWRPRFLLRWKMAAAEVQPLLAAVIAKDHARAAELLRALASDHLLPGAWVRANADAIAGGCFDALSEPFKACDFVGPSGHMLVVGPYTQNRGHSAVTCLSALFGQVVDHQPTRAIAATLEAIQSAPLRQPVHTILPIHGLAGCGNLGGEEGEAFVVPDGWGWPSSAQGPAINDMLEQSRRFETAGRRCIERIFDADTAAFLLAPMDPSRGGDRVRHRSYELHDAGHSSGHSFAAKVKDGLLAGFWYRAVEEWRADGVAFELGARLLSETDAANDLASNFCVRFGVDAHRTGGSDSDQDVACTLLMLDRLLRDGALCIRGGRLSLRDLTSAGLIRAFEGERFDTIELTRKELASAQPTAVLRLYGTMSVQPASEVILHGLVREPCRGFFTALR